jgi:hypothetical protein
MNKAAMWMAADGTDQAGERHRPNPFKQFGDTDGQRILRW